MTKAFCSLHLTMASHLHGVTIRQKSEEEQVPSKFAGIDVNSSNIEVAIRPDDEFWTTGAGEKGVTETADRLVDVQPELVVLEAYGRFELPLVGALATAGLPFALVQSWNIREFARAIGRVTRTDKHQAGLLAHFAELVHPEPQVLPAEVLDQLKDLRSRRSELLSMMTSERSRLQSACPSVNRDVQAHLQYLDRALRVNSEHLNRTIRIGRVH
jgi:transposase